MTFFTLHKGGNPSVEPDKQQMLQELLDGLFLNNAYASLYIAIRLEKTARMIMRIAKILSLFMDMPYRSLHK